MEDIGLALADFVSNMENVPSEIRHLFSEITDLDEKYEEAMTRAYTSERSLQKTYKDETNRSTPCERESQLLEQIDKEHTQAQSLCQEKLRLTRKAMSIVHRHLSKLDMEIRHYDKTDENPNRAFSVDTVRIQDGELAFTLPTPKRFSDAVPAALDGTLDAFYTPSRVPKRRMPGASRKKQFKLANSILSMDGVEVNNSGTGIEESDDQPYCFCQQVSYGDMVACDGSECRYEWFHWECVGLSEPPKGKWYCSECLAKLLEDDDE